MENGPTILWEDIYNFSFSGFLFCIGNRKFCSSIAKETYTIVCHFCKFCGRFSYWLQILFGKEASSVSKCSTSNYTKTERKLEHRNSVSYSFSSISGKISSEIALVFYDTINTRPKYKAQFQVRQRFS